MLWLWGVIALRRNRFFQRQMAEFIVARVRAMLQLAINYIRSFDRIEVIYGDLRKWNNWIWVQVGNFISNPRGSPFPSSLPLNSG